MARKRSSWRSTGRRIGKSLGRKSPARRRNNFVRPVELGVERLEPRWVLAAGALDTTFDPIDLDGVLIGNLGLPATANVQFNAVTTQADGKILAAGKVDLLATNEPDFVVARFNSNGSLDTTFGVDGPDAGTAPDGFITFDFNSSSDGSFANELTLDSLGRIIVVGSGPSAAHFGSFAVARLTTSGLLDSTFGTGGKVVTPWTGLTGNLGATANGVAVQANGKIVVVGSVNEPSFLGGSNWGIARYNANGTLDTSFGPNGDGKIEQNFFGLADEAYDVQIQADGKIVAAGYATSTLRSDDFALARYDVNGNLDPTFGSGGLVNTDVVPGSFLSQDRIKSITIQPDGHIVASGWTSTRGGSLSNYEYDFVVGRYLANGTPDATLIPAPGLPSSPGTVRVDFGFHADRGEAVGIQANGNYVVAGSIASTAGFLNESHDDNDAFGLAGLAPNGSLDPTFGSGGRTTTQITNYVPGTINGSFLNDMTLQPDGKIVAVGYLQGSDGKEKFIMARYDGLVTADVNEGQSYTLALSSSDPTTGAWTINWGDGSPAQVVSGNPTSVAHVYADGNNNYTIVATAPTSTLPVTITVPVTVHNVAPTLVISGASDVNEGSSYTLSLSSSDPGADTISQWTINWGDGTQVVSGNPSSVTHTYADGNASRTISATATDEDGTYTAGNTVAVAVHNVAPTLAISGASDVNEGSPYTLSLSSTDPGTDTITQWTINWGDGTQIVSGNPTSVAHTYADGNAAYSISATATDEDGTFSANTVSVTVHDVAPTLAISGAASVNEGSSYTLNLSSSDPGADVISQWTINWGDTTQVVSGNPASVAHTYADGAASYTISATATNEDGTYAAGNTVLVAVLNVAPALAISGAADVDEASSYTLNLSSSDPGTDTISQWTINWGDGTQVVSGNPSSATHTYADGNASYTISATATDEDGTFAAGNTVGVTVHNVAPLLAISGAATVNEGTSYTLNLSSSDPGADTITSWTITWGDGNIQTVSGNPSSALHTYADGSNNYTISATATDEDGTFASNSMGVAVNNVAPILAISGNTTVDEGTAYTLNLSSSDQGADTIASWTIAWGDGNVQTVSGNPSSALHTYADGSNNYTITATATDEDGTYSAGNTVGVTVNNAAPTLAISGAATVNEGTSYTLNLSSSDPGADTITSWTITWGDGNIQTVSGNPSSVIHTYADGPNSYMISATATDEDGTFAAGNTVAVTVNNVAPTLTISGASNVDEGSPYTLNLSSFDPGADTITSWTITWGDGIVQTVSGNPSSATHTYADGSNNYTISATATDEDGTFAACNTVGVTVNNVAPTLAISGAANVNEGSSYTLNLSKSDPGTDTIDHWTINWGDSTQVVAGNPASVTHTYADGDANYTISATATDEDGTFASNTVGVTVHNVAPTANNATFTLAENSPNGTVVGTVTATDPGNDTLSFSIVGGTGAAAFAINAATGQITVANSSLLDFETTPTLTLNVQVNDGDGGFATASVTVNLVNLASISGVVFVDVNQNGLFDANEPGIDGVVIKLLDQSGNAVLDGLGQPITETTSNGGLYIFDDLAPGTYQLFEMQPTGVTDGAEHLGSLGGTVVANDRMRLTLAGVDAYDYAFAEIGQHLMSGDAATIGFWQNKNGQALITQGGTQLAAWLTSNFSNIFGNAFVGATGADVAKFYREQLFKQESKKSAGPAKVDAQFMAVALATYFTSNNLAGAVAASYGFHVTDTGIGTKIVNVGTKGAAFSTANGSDRTITQLLLATNSLTDQPNAILGFAAIYDTDGNGVISSAEAALRTMANDLFTFINESGGV